MTAGNIALPGSMGAGVVGAVLLIAATSLQAGGAHERVTDHRRIEMLPAFAAMPHSCRGLQTPAVTAVCTYVASAAAFPLRSHPVRLAGSAATVERRSHAARARALARRAMRPPVLDLRSEVCPPQERDPRKINQPVRVASWVYGEDGQVFSEVIDVRSPAEFEEDHIPGAINLPCMSNEQRHEVGLLYDSSPFEARKVGAAHVCRNMALHMDTHFASKDKSYRPLVYCWRGGQRSGSVALILAEVGFRASILQGGYKYYRACVQAELKMLPSAVAGQLRLLSGPTGSCKTRLLKRLRHHGHQVLDLEGAANHRGSVLGGQLLPQPSQKAFETRLHSLLSGLDATKPIWLESESSNIGRIQVPHALFEAMKQAPRFEVRMPLQQRVAATLEEYSDLTRNSGKLKELMAPLERYTPRDTWGSWMRHIDHAQWPQFVELLLLEHYDPKYHRSQKSHAEKYNPPSTDIHVKSYSQADLDDAVLRLVSE